MADQEKVSQARGRWNTEKTGVLLTLVLASALVGILSAPTYSASAHGFGTSFVTLKSSPSLSIASHWASHATPTPAVNFPRTVLVETFTGEWCYYCQQESQAFYAIEHDPNTTSVTIPELHVCYSQSNCGDNYASVDGTSNTRASFYGVSGFPDVFFDGGTQILGAASTLAALEAEYRGAIANASAIPANVSISEHATVSYGNVTTHSTIASGLTGTFHVVTYLLEAIDKNDSSHHDIQNVVRESIYEQTVSLTAGASKDVYGWGAIGAMWNPQKLSIVTFVQDNSTMIVENANSVPVTTLTAGVSASATDLSSGEKSTITVVVANSSTGTPVSGATVSLSSSAGGSLNPASGSTASDGSFTSSYTAPTVTSTVTDSITAEISASGYTSGVGVAAIVVNPLTAPAPPTNLVVTAQNQQVALNWSIPATGAGGINYYVYRSTTESGTYDLVAMATSTVFADPSVVGGQSYWYKISAHSSGGFSVNSSAVSATGATLTPQGLPSTIQWWFSVDATTFSSYGGTTLDLYLPAGMYTCDYGPAAYAFQGSDLSGPVTITANGVSVFANLTFTPRYATVEGTVSPVNAKVTLDGTALGVANGAFQQLKEEGTYTIQVSADGYQSNTTQVILTPGNSTTLNFHLQANPSQQSLSGSGGGGGLSSDQILLIVVVVAVVAVAGVAAVATMRSRKMAQRPRGGPGGPRAP